MKKSIFKEAASVQDDEFLRKPHGRDQNATVLIPNDFPIAVPAPFALGGVQLKLNLTRDVDGGLYEAGLEPSHRLHRFRECLQEIEWAVELLSEKLLKPKYLALERDVILKMLAVNLVRDRALTPPEASWVLEQVAPRINWPRDRSPDR